MVSDPLQDFLVQFYMNSNETCSLPCNLMLLSGQEAGQLCLWAGPDHLGALGRAEAALAHGQLERERLGDVGVFLLERLCDGVPRLPGKVAVRARLRVRAVAAALLAVEAAAHLRRMWVGFFSNFQKT